MTKNAASQLLLSFLLGLTLGCSKEKVAILHVEVGLRQSPDSDSEVVSSLADDLVVSVLGRDGQWLKVKSGETIGYIPACLATVTAKGAEAAYFAKLKSVEPTLERSAAMALYGKDSKTKVFPDLDTVISQAADTKYYPAGLARKATLQLLWNEPGAFVTVSLLRENCSLHLGAGREALFKEEDVAEYALKMKHTIKEIEDTFSADRTGTRWIEYGRDIYSHVEVIRLRGSDAYRENKRTVVGTVSYGDKVEQTRVLWDSAEVSAGGKTGWIDARVLIRQEPPKIAGTYEIRDAANGTTFAFRTITFVHGREGLEGVLTVIMEATGEKYELKHTGFITEDLSPPGSRLTFECERKEGLGCTFRGKIIDGRMKGTLTVILPNGEGKIDVELVTPGSRPALTATQTKVSTIGMFASAYSFRAPWSGYERLEIPDRNALKGVLVSKTGKRLSLPIGEATEGKTFWLSCDIENEACDDRIEGEIQADGTIKATLEVTDPDEAGAPLFGKITLVPQTRP